MSLKENTIWEEQLRELAQEKESEVCQFCFGTGEINIDQDDGEGHIQAGVGIAKCFCQIEEEDCDSYKDNEENR